MKKDRKIMNFAEQVEAVINNDTISLSSSYLLMGQTPKILGKFGFDTSLPLLVIKGKLKDILSDKPSSGRRNHTKREGRTLCGRNRRKHYDKRLWQTWIFKIY